MTLYQFLFGFLVLSVSLTGCREESGKTQAEKVEELYRSPRDPVNDINEVGKTTTTEAKEKTPYALKGRRTGTIREARSPI